MKSPRHLLYRVAGGTILAFAAACAVAAPVTQTVVQSTDYGLLSLPYTQGFNLSLGPMASNDTFLSDYGFSIGSSGSLTSAAVTFDLGSAFQISDLTVSLLQGSAWNGPVPSNLTAAQVADRDARVIVTGSGMPTTQTIDQMTLTPGNYVVEVSGTVTGANGGSFAGLLNVAAVPEPAGFALALAGFGLLAVARRRVSR